MKPQPALPSWDDEDVLLQLRIQPRASIDGFAETRSEHVRLRVKAPPLVFCLTTTLQLNKANAYPVALLSEWFGVSRRAVDVETGRSSRLKRIRVVRPARLPPEIRR